MGVSYDTDVKKLRAVLREVPARSSLVFKEPAPVVGISSLGDSNIMVSVKPWVAVDNFVPAGAQDYEEIVEASRTSDIDMPFPQQEVRLLHEALDGASLPLSVKARA